MSHQATPETPHLPRTLYFMPHSLSLSLSSPPVRHQLRRRVIPSPWATSRNENHHHRSPEQRRARRQATYLTRVLKPKLGGPPGLDAINKLAKAFGGPRGHVTHEAILATLRVEESILTSRFYTLLGGRERNAGGSGGEPLGSPNRRTPARRATLEELLHTLANLKARIPIRTRAVAVSRARTMSDQEARLEFAFALYDLDGNGRVSREEVADIVERSMAGNEKKVATTVRVALGCDRAVDERGNGDGDGVIDFVEFRRVAEKLPGFLYPSFSLYEILMEHAPHAATALALLHSAPTTGHNTSAAGTGVVAEGGRGGGGGPRDRYAVNGGDGGDDVEVLGLDGEGYRVGGVRRRRGSRGGDGGEGGESTSSPGMQYTELDPGEVTSRFAAMSTRELKAHLTRRGMSYAGCVDKLELVDLAVAGSLSTGEPPPPPPKAKERRGSGGGGGDDPRQPPPPGGIPQDGEEAAECSGGGSGGGRGGGTKARLGGSGGGRHRSLRDGAEGGDRAEARPARSGGGGEGDLREGCDGSR